MRVMSLHYFKVFGGYLIVIICIIWLWIFHHIYTQFPSNEAYISRETIQQNNDLNIIDSNALVADDLLPLNKPPNIGEHIFAGFINDKSGMSLRFQRMGTELRHLNAEHVDQFDDRLIKLIRRYWILRPSPEPYNLSVPTKTDFSMGQSNVVDGILNQMEGGFFVECGALDGETRSNSLFFERQRHWRGLLIEVGPINYRKLVEKRRKAYSTPSCLGVKTYPNVMYFNRGKNQGRLIDNGTAYDWVASQKLKLRLMEVQCFPLTSLLLALNRTHIDYLSLDVEGVELAILQTIPFDKVSIRVLTVEFSHSREGKEAIEQFMSSKGYFVHSLVKRADSLANDFVFVPK